jgi:hypothetical protein
LEVFRQNDRKYITPTLILPPQGGGDLRINPSLLRGRKLRKRKDGFDESNPYIRKK